MAILSEPNPAPEGAAGYHGAVSEFKRRLIERSLLEARGNRTHAARALGLQRTYLLRLMRDLNVTAPPAPDRHRRAADLSPEPAPPPPAEP